MGLFGFNKNKTNIQNAINMYSKDNITYPSNYKLFTQNADLNTSISMILNTFNELNIFIVGKEKIKIDEIFSKILLKILVFGTAYLHLRNVSRKSIDTDYIEVLFNEDITIIDGYNLNDRSIEWNDKYTNNTYYYHYDQDLKAFSNMDIDYIVPITKQNIKDDIIGENPLKPILNEIFLLIKGLEFNSRKFENELATSFAVSMKTTTLEQESNLINRFERFKNGTSSILLMPEGSQIIKDLGIPLKDMDYINLRKECQKVIYMYYGINSAIHDNSASTYNNLSESFANIYRNVVKPYFKDINRQITRIFKNILDEEVEITYNQLSLAPIIKEVAEYSIDLLKNGIISIDEARNELGLDVSSEKYTDKLLIGSNITLLDEIETKDDI